MFSWICSHRITHFLSRTQQRDNTSKTVLDRDVTIGHLEEVILSILEGHPLLQAFSSAIFRIFVARRAVRLHLQSFLLVFLTTLHLGDTKVLLLFYTSLRSSVLKAGTSLR